MSSKDRTSTREADRGQGEEGDARVNHEGCLIRATRARCIAHLVRRFPLGDQLIGELRGRAAPDSASPPVNAAVAGRKLAKPGERCRVLEKRMDPCLAVLGRRRRAACRLICTALEVVTRPRGRFLLGRHERRQLAALQLQAVC